MLKNREGYKIFKTEKIEETRILRTHKMKLGKAKGSDIESNANRKDSQIRLEKQDNGKKIGRFIRVVPKAKKKKKFKNQG